MAGFSSGMYGVGRRNWMQLLMGVGAGALIGIIVVSAYFLLRGKNSAPTDVPVETETAGAVTYAAKTQDANEQVTVLINQAMSLLKTNPPKTIEARDSLNEILPMPMSAGQRQFVKSELSKLSEKWLFSSAVLPGDKLCGYYKVESGDLLTRIGSQHQVPYEILMEINGISKPQQLHVDDTIKIINGPFHAKVHRSAFTLDLYLQNTYVKSFKVGLGKTGKDTPTGLWQVKSDGKLISPTWTDPDTGKTYKAEDPDYPLGSRWIALEGIEGEAVGRTGFAIHGTKDPNQIGKAESRGCIRMFNGDAVLMYNLLMPGVSQVQVLD
jgi:LysM repeat protein